MSYGQGALQAVEAQRASNAVVVVVLAGMEFGARGAVLEAQVIEGAPSCLEAGQRSGAGRDGEHMQLEELVTL